MVEGADPAVCMICREDLPSLQSRQDGVYSLVTLLSFLSCRESSKVVIRGKPFR